MRLSEIALMTPYTAQKETLKSMADEAGLLSPEGVTVVTITESQGMSLSTCHYEYRIVKTLEKKTFAFRYKMRISRIKLSRIATIQLLCRCSPRTCATHPHTCNVRIVDLAKFRGENFHGWF